jgi:hypothetical protein
MAKYTLMQTIEREENSTVFLSILNRIDQTGDRGLGGDRIMTIAGYSYWRSSESSDRTRQSIPRSLTFLRQLEKKGLTQSVDRPFGANEPLRYRLTKKGAIELARRRAEFDRRL